MESNRKQKLYNISLIAISLLSLAMVYVFQRWDYLNFIAGAVGAKTDVGPTATFVVNKTVRLLLNDASCLLLIYALFREKKYLRIAFLVFCFEFFLMLPLYLTLKLSLEGTSELSSPLLSQIHRLIVNPMLMLILVVAFYYQRFWVGNKGKKE
jgi:exosortase F-associated protein